MDRPLHPDSTSFPSEDSLDAEAFREIFEEHLGRVFRFFADRGFPHEESMDLTQEVFLRVYKSLGSFRREAHFDTWLFQIARNVFRNAIRDRAARKRSGTEISLDKTTDWERRGASSSEQQEEGEGLPLSRLLVEERTRQVRQALDDLPPRMRHCVLLRVDRELKYQEIAAVMQTSVDSVKALLYRARKLLQEQLGHLFSDLEF